MATVLNVPVNISKGTAISDGFRVAPAFQTLSSTGVNAAGNLISGASFNNYGPGMLLTPTSTWNITPYATGNGPAANIVLPTTTTGAGWLTLAGDGVATQLIPSNNPSMFPPGAPTQFYLQLDWPRVPQFSVINAAVGGNANVTFFGFDWYGQPMQSTYVVNQVGNYPTGLLAPGATGQPNPLPGQKAFYIITGVYFRGTTGAGCSVSAQVSNTFGLPYVLKSWSDVNTFKWNSLDMMTQSGSFGPLAGGASMAIQTPAIWSIINTLAAPTTSQQAPQLTLTSLSTSANTGALSVNVRTPPSLTVQGSFTVASNNALDTGTIAWSIINGGQYIVKSADTTAAATATTGDVRGLVQLPGILQATGAPGAVVAGAPETWAALPNGALQLVFNYYCEGFDQWINILAAGGQPQGPVNAIPTNLTKVQPNTSASMYGVQQFYSGIPA